MLRMLRPVGDGMERGVGLIGGCAVTGEMQSLLFRRAPTSDIGVGSRNGGATAGAPQIGSYCR